MLTTKPAFINKSKQKWKPQNKRNIKIKLVTCPHNVYLRVQFVPQSNEVVRRLYRWNSSSATIFCTWKKYSLTLQSLSKCQGPSQTFYYLEHKFLQNPLTNTVPGREGEGSLGKVRPLCIYSVNCNWFWKRTWWKCPKY